MAAMWGSNVCQHPPAATQMAPNYSLISTVGPHSPNSPQHHESLLAPVLSTLDRPKIGPRGGAEELMDYSLGWSLLALLPLVSKGVIVKLKLHEYVGIMCQSRS